MSAANAKRKAERAAQEARTPPGRWIRTRPQLEVVAGDLAAAVVELATEVEHLKRDLRRVTVRVNR
jgi:hypothetical protein